MRKGDSPIPHCAKLESNEQSIHFTRLLDKGSKTHQRTAIIGKIAHMVDLEVKLWIKLILYHAPETDQAVMREAVNRGGIQQRNLKI